jgi:hypothetical protein
MASCRWCGVSLSLRPNLTPRACARFRPSSVVALISSRSNQTQQGTQNRQHQPSLRGRGVGPGVSALLVLSMTSAHQNWRFDARCRARIMIAAATLNVLQSDDLGTDCNKSGEQERRGERAATELVRYGRFRFV